MAKRVLALLLALMMVLALAGCTGGKEEQPENAQEPEETEQPEPTETAEKPAWKPNGPVNLLVPDENGSFNDITARVLAQYLERYIGQTVTVEDIPGGVTQVNDAGETVLSAGPGTLGWQELIDRDADGMTLGYVKLPDLTKAQYQWPGLCPLEDFAPVCTHTTQTAVIVARDRDERFSSLEELVAYAQANPGVLIAATDGERGLSHSWIQAFAKDKKLSYGVNHQGSAGGALQCLLDGTADFCAVRVDDLMERDEGLKVLGVFSEERLAAYPDAPTLGELGYYSRWQGCAYCVVMNAEVDPEAVTFYEKAFQQAMEDSRYLAASSDVVTEYRDAAATAELIEQQRGFALRASGSLW